MEKKGRVAAYTKEPNMQTCYLICTSANMYAYALHIVYVYTRFALRRLVFYQNQLQELTKEIEMIHELP